MGDSSDSRSPNIETGPAPVPDNLQPMFFHERPILYRAWHRVQVRARLPHEAGVVVVLLGYYTLGALIAAALGELPQFVAFFILPALLVIDAIGLIGVDLARVNYGRILWKWTPDFDEPYLSQVRDHWDRINYAARAHILSVFGLLMALSYVIAIRATDAQLFPIPAISRPILLGNPILFLYIAIVVCLTGYLGGLGIHITLEHIQFVDRIRRIRLNPQRLLMGETELVEFAWFSFAISVTWFISLGVVAFVFYGDFDLVTYSIYFSGILIGFLLFFLPQYYLHRLVSDSKLELVAEIAADVPPDFVRIKDPTARQMALTSLILIRSIDSIEEWPVNVRVVATEMIAATLPIFVAVFGPAVGFGHL